MKVGDLVIYDGTTDGIKELTKGKTSFFIVGFSPINSKRILIGNVDDGHTGGVFNTIYRKLLDHKGEIMKKDARDGSSTFYWVGINSLTRFDPIRLNKKQIKSILLC